MSLERNVTDFYSNCNSIEMPFDDTYRHTFINSKYYDNNELKVGLSPSSKVCVICFTESPLKMMKNVFYFYLKALFVLNIFKFLS